MIEVVVRNTERDPSLGEGGNIGSFEYHPGVRLSYVGWRRLAILRRWVGVKPSQEDKIASLAKQHCETCPALAKQKKALLLTDNSRGWHIFYTCALNLQEDYSDEKRGWAGVIGTAVFALLRIIDGFLFNFGFRILPGEAKMNAMKICVDLGKREGTIKAKPKVVDCPLSKAYMKRYVV